MARTNLGQTLGAAVSGDELVLATGWCLVTDELVLGPLEDDGRDE